LPTVTVQFKDLLNLVGKKMSVEEIEAIFFLTKCEVEAVESEEVTLEVTADRPDLLSTEGIARELRGILGLEKGLKEYKIGKSDFIITVEPSIEGIRPFISSGVIKGIELNSESVRQVMQLQEKLHLTCCRARRKVSVGIHDLDNIEKEIIYAGVEPKKINFIPLEEDREMNGEEILERIPKGREYSHIIKKFPRYPLLYDIKGNVLSLPPIINGTVTKVTESTKNLLFDVTGTDPDLVEFVNNIMVTNLVERGGEIESVKIVNKDSERYVPILKANRINIGIDFVNKTLGLGLNKSEIIESLEKMRYGIAKGEKDMIEVLAPSYRADLLHEIDIVEDVALGYGINRLEPELPKISTMGIERELTKSTRKACNLMVGLGFQEVLNYLMTNEESLFNKMAVSASKIVQVENPLTLEYSAIRNSILPGLMNFLGYNKHISYPQRIFECGDVVILDEKKPTKTMKKRKLAGAICDYKVSYESIQSVLYAFLNNFGINNWSLSKTENSAFIKGRVASLQVNKSKNYGGIIGEINPIVLNNFEIENPVAAFEIELEDLIKAKKL
jgi:phenylalanyl-tRNA synthetase beta chain